MSERLSLEAIREFWRAQAQSHGQDPAASWSDRWAIELEVREILRHLDDGDRVLDVGCANGFSTVRYAAAKAIAIRGLDYIPEMVAEARARLTQPGLSLRGTVEFDVGDITALAEPPDSRDKLVVVRVLINLRTHEAQVGALRECARVLRPGGELLLSEATLQGWRRLNAMRTEWQLPEIPMPGFNEYIDEDRLVGAVPELELIDVVNFSSTYFVGTRVLKPLLAAAANADVPAASPDMEWNRWFASLPAWGDYGTQKLLKFRRN